MNRRNASIVGIGCLIAGVVFVIWNPLELSLVNGDEKSKSKRDFNPQTALRKPIRAIRNAEFIAADNVDDQVHDNELVLGVVVKGEARAYPINMLTGPSREIINDTLGGTAIAATW